MASSFDFVEYVTDQIRGAGAITSKKMFGEYMIYADAKPVLLVCDNIVYAKKLDCVQNLLQTIETGFPYPGAKEHFILDADHGEALSAIVRELKQIAKLPKKKTKKR